jgi:hypothetical protein
MFNLDKTVFEVSCPLCKFPNSVTVREARFGLKIPCRGCKRHIQLEPMDAGLTRAKKALDRFIAEFPKEINIKL